MEDRRCGETQPMVPGGAVMAPGLQTRRAWLCHKENLIKRFNVLARNAEAFFEEAGGESWNAQRIAEQNWALLSAAQKASADGIRRELRKTLSLLVPEIQDAPLLDK